jgi:myo-inositol-1(or 4)-monophosphatase
MRGEGGEIQPRRSLLTLPLVPHASLRWSHSRVPNTVNCMNGSTPSQTSRVDFAKTLALTGGEAIRGVLPTDRVGEKEGRGNFVTAADEASEKAILQLIAEMFPGDEILSEESMPRIGDLSAVPHLWIIDPMDGTNNFRFGRQYAAVSVGYVEGGELRGGAVYDPFRNELFFAQKGGGALLNAEVIRVRGHRHLPSASVATDNCYEPAGTRRNLELCLRISPSPWILVRGSAVLSMCEVACGRTDLYFHTALQPWDNAAAFLIVREAGGRVVGFDGADAPFVASSAIVGNSDLVEQCVRWFQPK